MIALSSRWRIHLFALVGYAVCAIVFTWPLAPQLGTHLTGSPAGDTGVYVWNQWVFQHEILEQGRFPYFTDKIFSLTGRANLSLHNYTAFQDLIALPLIGWLGIIATFNLVYLLMTVLTGYATFLLARHVTGRDAEAWLAGLLFAWSPVLVTRGTAHFSLVAAAPLPLFLLLLLRTTERQRLRDALALGATVAWAATVDAYYAVYCIVIAAVFMVGRVLTIQWRGRDARRRVVPWTLDVLLFCVAGLVLSMVISGGWQFSIRGRVASIRSLYTPMMILTMLAAARVAWSCRTTVVPFRSDVSARACCDWRRRPACSRRRCCRRFCTPSASGLPTIDGIRSISSGAAVRGASIWLPSSCRTRTIHWRQTRSARGSRRGRMPISKMSPRWCSSRSPPSPSRGAPAGGSRGCWGAFALVFGALALGPFVHVAGINTHIPGPWSLLRYVPVIGLARTPSRFSIVAMLMVAILFGAGADVARPAAAGAPADAPDRGGRAADL